MRLKTELYECHITCEPPTEKYMYEALAEAHGWKTSFIEGDPLLGNRGFFYFTSYDTTYLTIQTKMDTFAELIPGKVLRKKIELIVYDTKTRLL